MGRFTEKQIILATIIVAILVSSGFGALIWLDRRAIYAYEIGEDGAGADGGDPEQYGENRKIQEIKKQMDAAKTQADLIPKREQDVIVYREIVNRDAQILPEFDDVNNLARTINDHQDQSGVALRQVSDLTIKKDGDTIKVMPIKLALSGTFDQFLKFLSLFENHDRIINVRAFSVQQGKTTGQGKERRAIHEIQLDLVTYIYSPTAGIAKPVEIANYDKRKDDPVIQKLVRQQKPARVEKYQLKPRINRRDPLVDPRRPSGDAASGDPADAQKQRDLVEKLKFDVELLKEDVRQLAQFVQDKKYVAYTGLKPIVDEKSAKLDAEIVQADPTITVPELHEAFRDDVVAPFEGIRSQLKLTATLPPIMAKKDAEQFVTTMKTCMETRDYEKVVKTFQSFESLLKGQEVAEDAVELVSEMRALAKDARVMIEFLALRVRTTGLILRPTEGSLAIINGKPRRVGDFVDASNRCRLKEIHQEKLVFELDGLEIEHENSKK